MDAISVTAADEFARIPHERSLIAANNRLAKFRDYLNHSSGEQEFDLRLANVWEDMREVVAEACDEYMCTDYDDVYTAAVEQLKSSLHFAKDDGDSYQSETQSLPKGDGKEAVEDEPSGPPLSKSHEAPEQIDIGSKAHPHTKQDVSKEPDWGKDPTGPSSTGERVKVDEYGAEQKGPKTKTFPNEGQAPAVTAKSGSWTIRY